MTSPKSSRSSSPVGEESRRLESWEPEPLVPTSIDYESNRHIFEPEIITSIAGKYINLNGKNCLNFVTHNYLGINDDPRLREASVAAVRKYGVGSCGPRGFYGTMDVHLKLEAELAKFLNLEEAVLYSFAFSTFASAIPAYAKASDIVYVDENCNFAIQQGLKASRSKIVQFKHNDASDLEKSIENELELMRKDHRSPKKVRTFIVVESIYAKTGQMCPLKEIINIKRKHKIRLFIDESRSFGVLGAQGRGITEHHNLDINDIDLIMVSLETSLCGYGGFCAGSSFVVDHQRLAGTGYCFSASLPPLQTEVAFQSLQLIQNETDIIHEAQEKFEYAGKKLDNTLTKLKNISHPLAPFKILVITDKYSACTSIIDQAIEDEKKLEAIVEEIKLKENIALAVARYLRDEEMVQPNPSIRMIVNRQLTHQDIDKAVCAIEKYSNSIL